ncbi:hypothetical protein I316_01739 [Kwoniella heveanensis BCC8398]|uniref:UDP-glycosyltransferases domain-containing protein n=1 Tax=Kwoniella heveanensis BCC8398 TaxID=1296120 RepID=A0A1B9GZP7_9TREE|nr:hypothetical protein I316_01739 [Kwoniella heveanensis BCC8398]
MSAPGLKSHFVFATTFAYSHVPSIIHLSLSLLRHAPDLCISIIMHKNNEKPATQLAEAGAGEGGKDNAITQQTRDRLQFWPVGEDTQWNDTKSAFMTMVFKSGEAYAGILATHAPWPVPSVFIYDITSFFYVSVKMKVEENFPHITPPKSVGYIPYNMGETMLLGGSEENGSFRWVDAELPKEGVATPDLSKLVDPVTGAVVPLDTKEHEKLISAYRKCVTESHRLVNLPGYSPFYVFERWGNEIDWTELDQIGWFSYLTGYQACVQAPELFISCFPSSVIEKETLAAARADPILSRNGTRQLIEFECYERKPTGNWGEGVKEFLDRHQEKEVAYVSFGTIVNAGFGLPTLFAVLTLKKIPFIYACGNQKSSLPEEIRAILAEGEEKGLCIAPDWVDQIAILHHESVGCFVSHCGANSTVEAIAAGVPIISWGRIDDQVLLASLVHSKKIGIELLQHRSGYVKGHEVAHRKGVVMQATPEALRAELKEAFDRIRGPEGDKMRERLRIIDDEIKSKREGEWVENVQKFGQYGRA